MWTLDAQEEPLDAPNQNGVSAKAKTTSHVRSSESGVPHSQQSPSKRKSLAVNGSDTLVSPARAQQLKHSRQSSNLSSSIKPAVTASLAVSDAYYPSFAMMSITPQKSSSKQQKKKPHLPPLAPGKPSSPLKGNADNGSNEGKRVPPPRSNGAAHSSVNDTQHSPHKQSRSQRSSEARGEATGLGAHTRWNTGAFSAVSILPEDESSMSMVNGYYAEDSSVEQSRAPVTGNLQGARMIVGKPSQRKSAHRTSLPPSHQVRPHGTTAEAGRSRQSAKDQDELFCGFFSGFPDAHLLSPPPSPGGLRIKTHTTTATATATSTILDLPYYTVEEELNVSPPISPDPAASRGTDMTSSDPLQATYKSVCVNASLHSANRVGSVTELVDPHNAHLLESREYSLMSINEDRSSVRADPVDAYGGLHLLCEPPMSFRKDTAARRVGGGEAGRGDKSFYQGPHSSDDSDDDEFMTNVKGNMVSRGHASSHLISAMRNGTFLGLGRRGGSKDDGDDDDDDEDDGDDEDDEDDEDEDEDKPSYEGGVNIFPTFRWVARDGEEGPPKEEVSLKSLPLVPASQTPRHAGQSTAKEHRQGGTAHTHTKGFPSPFQRRKKFDARNDGRSSNRPYNNSKYDDDDDDDDEVFPLRTREEESALAGTFRFGHWTSSIVRPSLHDRRRSSFSFPQTREETDSEEEDEEAEEVDEDDGRRNGYVPSTSCDLKPKVRMPQYLHYSSNSSDGRSTGDDSDDGGADGALGNSAPAVDIFAGKPRTNRGPQPEWTDGHVPRVLNPFRPDIRSLRTYNFTKVHQLLGLDPARDIRWVGSPVEAAALGPHDSHQSTPTRSSPPMMAMLDPVFFHRNVAAAPAALSGMRLPNVSHPRQTRPWSFS